MVQTQFPRFNLRAYPVWSRWLSSLNWSTQRWSSLRFKRSRISCNRKSNSRSTTTHLQGQSPTAFRVTQRWFQWTILEFRGPLLSMVETRLVSSKCRNNLDNQEIQMHQASNRQALLCLSQLLLIRLKMERPRAPCVSNLVSLSKRPKISSYKSRKRTLRLSKWRIKQAKRLKKTSKMS